MGRKRDFTERPKKGLGKSAKKQGAPELPKSISKSGWFKSKRMDKMVYIFENL